MIRAVGLLIAIGVPLCILLSLGCGPALLKAIAGAL